MVVLRMRLPSGREFSLAPRHLLLLVCAVLVAVALLAQYVRMLNESVARGDRMRGEWGAAVAPTRAGAKPTPTAAR